MLPSIKKEYQVPRLSNRWRYKPENLSFSSHLKSQYTIKTL